MVVKNTRVLAVWLVNKLMFYGPSADDWGEEV